MICFETITQLTITPCVNTTLSPPPLSVSPLTSSIPACTYRCGHMYCRACIESALGVASRCPTCRNPLTRGQLTQVLEEVRTPPPLTLLAAVEVVGEGEVVA